MVGGALGLFQLLVSYYALFFPYYRSGKPLMWVTTSKAQPMVYNSVIIAQPWYNTVIPWLWSASSCICGINYD